MVHFELLSFWECGILIYDWQKEHTWSVSNKNCSCWVSNGFPWAETSACVAAFLLLGDKWALSDQSWEESKRNPTHISLDSACVFSPLDLAVYPYYSTVINLSHAYNHMLIPWILVDLQIWVWSWRPIEQLLSMGILSLQALKSKTELMCFIRKL